MPGRPMAEVEAELLGPGGPFEIVEEPVHGEPMRVFRNRARSLREHLEASVAHGDTEYIVYGDRRLTYAAHERAVASTAAALWDRYGVGPGDRVAILAANCPEWAVTFWATVSLGAVAVGLNGWWAGDEIRYGVADSDPTLLVADRRRLERVDGGDGLGVPVVEIESGFDELWYHDLAAPLPSVAIDEDDPALILYTSGTTGRPKGAVNTHRNFNALLGIQSFHGLRQVLAAGIDPASQPKLKLFLTNPMFHVSGLHNAVFTGLVAGNTLVLNIGRFDPVTLMETVQRERCTNWSIVPTTAWRVVNHPDVAGYDLSSLTHVGGGGAPISPALQHRLREVLPNAHLRLGVGYGLTECTSLATVATDGDLARDPETVGRPLPTVDVEVRGPDGRPLPEGEEGEIHIRGPVVMAEYWRRPEATAETILPGRWLRTGDVGRLQDGYLYLSSRRSDLILRGGENVYPAEIENCLEGHPDVDEVAVVGVPHEELGQEVKAIVVPREGTAPAADELAAYVAERLAYFKVPAHWELRHDALPRNAAGKLLRHQVVAGGTAQFVEES